MHQRFSVPLAELRTGTSGVIRRVGGQGAFRKRITEMGFVKGRQVQVIKNAPLQDPVEYEIMGYRVSLRRSEARSIDVVPGGHGSVVDAPCHAGTPVEGDKRPSDPSPGTTITVAFVGNPNSGKTTLFNRVSGLHERIGNYGGVTVDAKEATITHGRYRLVITDLPGTYSLTEYTPEELFVRKHLIGAKPDVVVNVVDGSNLERNLFLTTQLIDMNVKTVIALNMFDELQQSGDRLDHEKLGMLLGIPIVPTVGVRGKGLEDLIAAIVAVHEGRDPISRSIRVHHGDVVEGAIAQVQNALCEHAASLPSTSVRYLAIALLSNDHAVLRDLQERGGGSIGGICDAEIRRIETAFGEKAETVIADAKYGFIAGALRETFVPAPARPGRSHQSIDSILTNRWLGFPVFFVFMWLMFQATFTLGSYPMDWIDAGVGAVGDAVTAVVPDGPARDLLVDGIIGGVGGVIVFLPNILILFFFISLMEDTGYMARVSFIMDRLMHLMGLHGKSFIPLLIGFGCNVPAVMATRTLESRKDRVVTMLVTPFMSCSARLPVFVLLISAFFPRNQGVVLLSIYSVGILMAILSALILNKIFFAKRDIPFVIELPPYRVPTVRNTTMHMWHKAAQYLKKMGGPILAASILIWALSYYPRDAAYSADYGGLMNRAASTEGWSDEQKDARVAELQLLKESERAAQSYIGRLGHAIEPAIRPLGFDWKIGVSILTGLAAKEIVVSSMGILYQADLNADETTGSLVTKLQMQTFTDGDRRGEKVFSPATAYALMLFVLIYFPCVAVIAAIKKEAGWGWAGFAMIYTTAAAWLVAFLVKIIGETVL